MWRDAFGDFEQVFTIVFERQMSFTQNFTADSKTRTRDVCSVKPWQVCSGISRVTTTTSRSGLRATLDSLHLLRERESGRNQEWTHVNIGDVLSMPDKWEYPWFAAWDLGIHCVAHGAY